VKDLSLHILDVVENSLLAEAKRIEISIVEDMENDVLTIQIEDDGKGMPPEMLCQASGPFFTTKPGRRFGLGLALFAQAAREAEGNMEVSSTPGAGTKIKATFRHGHPDRKPLGDIAATVETLVVGSPGVHFLYEHRRGADVARLDTRELRQ